jgi:(p)ppGpp synthase/HD superfamily hydrolase
MYSPFFISYMTLIEQATRVAVVAHKDQVRKSDGSPYVVHPIMCAMLLQRHGFPEVVVAATLVHDVLEDTPVTEEELRRELGNEVVDLVCMVTEDKSLEWRARKERYVDMVRNTSEGVKAVSLADKIHNMCSLLDAYEAEGPMLWGKFNRGKEDKLWFEESMLAMFRETWDHPLIEEYAVLIEKMHALT